VTGLRWLAWEALEWPFSLLSLLGLADGREDGEEAPHASAPFFHFHSMLRLLHLSSCP